MTTEIGLKSVFNLNEFLTQDEPEYDWLVPGLLERGDRLIITGNEGKGKSTLLRQMGIQIALGIDPFTLEKIPSKRVWYVDLENPGRQLRRKLKDIVSENVLEEESNFKLSTWPTGINLRGDKDRHNFTDLIKEVWPELLIIGPMYKMWEGNLEAEEQSKALAMYLDTLRDVIGCTILIETHQPHATITNSGKSRRPERPFGSSLWVRWPEFGMCLFDDGSLVPFRGARDERAWPKKLAKYGDTWPWELPDELSLITSCLKCGGEIPEGNSKYCSEKCGRAHRTAMSRAKAKATLQPELD